MMSPLMFAATLLVTQVPVGGVTPAGTAPDVGVPSGAIEGVVRTREGTDVRPLPFAIIQATMPGKQRAILADSLGRYRFEALPQGTVRLRVSHVAHRSARLNVAVPEGETVSVDIDLESSPIELRPVLVITDQIGFGVLVVLADVGHDAACELLGRGEDASVDEIAFDLGEPEFDLIEPG